MSDRPLRGETFIKQSAGIVAVVLTVLLFMEASQKIEPGYHLVAASAGVLWFVLWLRDGRRRDTSEDERLWARLSDLDRLVFRVPDEVFLVAGRELLAREMDAIRAHLNNRDRRGSGLDPIGLVLSPTDLVKGPSDLVPSVEKGGGEGGEDGAAVSETGPRNS